MVVYLIECGAVDVLYELGAQQFYMLCDHPNYLQDFILAQQAPDWQGAQTLAYQTKDLACLAINESTLLTQFCDPKKNPAVLARRDFSCSQPEIFSKKRFQTKLMTYPAR